MDSHSASQSVQPSVASLLSGPPEDESDYASAIASYHAELEEFRWSLFILTVCTSSSIAGMKDSTTSVWLELYCSRVVGLPTNLKLGVSTVEVVASTACMLKFDESTMIE